MALGRDDKFQNDFLELLALTIKKLALIYQDKPFFTKTILPACQNSSQISTNHLKLKSNIFEDAYQITIERYLKKDNKYLDVAYAFRKFLMVKNNYKRAEFTYYPNLHFMNIRAIGKDINLLEHYKFEPFQHFYNIYLLSDKYKYEMYQKVKNEFFIKKVGTLKKEAVIKDILCLFKLLTEKSQLENFLSYDMKNKKFINNRFGLPHPNIGIMIERELKKDKFNGKKFIYYFLNQQKKLGKNYPKFIKSLIALKKTNSQSNLQCYELINREEIVKGHILSHISDLEAIKFRQAYLEKYDDLYQSTEIKFYNQLRKLEKLEDVNVLFKILGIDEPFIFPALQVAQGFQMLVKSYQYLELKSIQYKPVLKHEMIQICERTNAKMDIAPVEIELRVDKSGAQGDSIWLKWAKGVKVHRTLYSGHALSGQPYVVYKRKDLQTHIQKNSMRGGRSTLFQTSPRPKQNLVKRSMPLPCQFCLFFKAWPETNLKQVWPLQTPDSSKLFVSLKNTIASE